MSDRLWYAVQTVGQFRRGQTYRNDQLGVLGRMAAKVGYLVPVEAPKRITTLAVDGTQKVVRPRNARRAKATKGVDGGDAQVQTGGGSEVRDDPGPQVGSDDDSGS